MIWEKKLIDVREWFNNFQELFILHFSRDKMLQIRKTFSHESFSD